MKKTPIFRCFFTVFLDDFDLFLSNFALNYSVRSAITGSFLAAAFAGIKPLISVNTTLMITIVTAERIGKDASDAIPVNTFKIALIPNCIK